MSGQARAPSQFAQLTQVYEAMRGRWCGESTDNGAHQGLELLLRRGTRAWMQVQHEVPSSPAAKSAAAVSAPGGDGAGLFPAGQVEVASLLLAMALSATRNEASP